MRHVPSTWCSRTCPWARLDAVRWYVDCGNRNDQEKVAYFLCFVFYRSFFDNIILKYIILLPSYTRYPYHASCSIEWKFSSSCDQVLNLLEGQMKVKNNMNKQSKQIELPSRIIMYVLPKAWEGDALCPNVSDTCLKMPCGQKCLYKVRKCKHRHHCTTFECYTDDQWKT